MELERELGKTWGLFLCLLKSYFTTRRYGVFDSGFCVLKAILRLLSKGLFACALTKKRWYWPVMVPGPAMDKRFEDKQVGAINAINREQG